MAAPLYYTAEMVRQLPDDGNRYEVVHGELLVTPAPRAVHQLVLERLAFALNGWLASHPVGLLLRAPADISWGPGILVQPDLFVVRMDEARTLDWRRMRHLLLAVEVLSPSSARADRFTKRRLYQERGVPLYWVVDADAATIEAWTPEADFPAFARDRLSWHPEGADDPFVLEIGALFRAP